VYISYYFPGYWFDPVAYARIDNSWKDESRRNDAAYLNDGMIKNNLVAKPIHISQTWVAGAIAKNMIKRIT